ncbi:YjzD family protein [Virgibacillus sp. CBA3643]
MRYIMTIFWAVAISAVVSYVLTSMAGAPFVLTDTLILAGIFAVAVIVLADFVLPEKKEQ